MKGILIPVLIGIVFLVVGASGITLDRLDTLGNADINESLGVMIAPKDPTVKVFFLTGNPMDKGTETKDLDSISASDDTWYNIKSTYKQGEILNKNPPIMRLEYNLSEVDLDGKRTYFKTEGHSYRKVGTEYKRIQMDLVVWKDSKETWIGSGLNGKWRVVTINDSYLYFSIPEDEINSYLTDEKVLKVAIIGSEADYTTGPVYYPSELWIDRAYIQLIEDQDIPDDPPEEDIDGIWEKIKEFFGKILPEDLGIKDEYVALIGGILIAFGAILYILKREA